MPPIKKFSKIRLLLLPVVFAFGCSRQTPPRLIDNLAQLQQQKRFAVGYIYDRKLSVVELAKSAHIRSYTIPGPGFYAVNIGPEDSLYGVNRQNEQEFIAMRATGEIMWRRKGLYAEEDPAVSPDGSKVVLKGRDKDTQQNGLLLVDDEGKAITLISHEGSGPSWSPDGSRLCYQQPNEILVYDLRSKQSHSIVRGTDAAWSPAGNLISFRSNESTFALIDANGNLKETFLSAKDILTPLSWSPDSQYLMYVKTGNSLHGIACSDASINIMVLRVRDGLTGSLLETCNTVSPRAYRWLYIPSNLPL